MSNTITTPAREVRSGDKIVSYAGIDFRGALVEQTEIHDHDGIETILIVWWQPEAASVSTIDGELQAWMTVMDLVADDQITVERAE